MVTATTSMDVYVVAPNTGTIRYTIQKNGTDIFHGKVYSIDEDNLAVIDINEIAKDYLNVSEPVLSATTVTQHPDAFAVFRFGSGFHIEDFAIRDDYSGEPWTGADKELSDPINGHADPRQMLLFSAFYNTTVYKEIIPQ